MGCLKLTYTKQETELKVISVGGKLTSEKTEKSTYRALEYRPYDAAAVRWLSVDPMAHRFPAWSPYSAMGNNPIYFVDPDGDAFFAFTKKSKNQTLSAIKLVFGENHGFEFKKNKLVYSGSGFHENKQKEYLVNLFVDEIVNSNNNHVYAKNSGYVVGDNNYYFSNNSQDRQEASNLGKNAFSIDGESTVTTQDGNTTKTTIFIGNSTNIGEGSPSITRSSSMLLWHGIGHALTNDKFNLDFKKADPNRATAQKQTVGFENFVARLAGLRERDGSNHGNVPNSSGTDNTYGDRARSYESLQNASNNGSGMFNVSQSENLDIVE